jgi:putative addiction module component (TIGR02574 family)
MAPDVAKLIESARALSRAQRADLAYQVLLSLDDGDDAEDRAEVEAAWNAEAARRLDDYLSGNRSTISVEEHHAQIRAGYSASR